MKRILFPTDFSDAAQNALDVAISLAKESNAELFVLHSLNSAQQYVDLSLSTAGDITMPGMQPEVVMAAIEEEKKRVDKKMEETVSYASSKGLKISSFVIHQALDAEINEYVAINEIDFIVMGTHGSSGLREAFLGSNAQRIVRKAIVPVLTVNDKYQDFKIKSIVYCSDFLEDGINAQLPRIKKFADAFNSELNLVYVNTPTYFEESKIVIDRMTKIIDDYDLSSCKQYIYNAFDIDEGAIAAADLLNADLISMTTHGYRGVKKLFSDNVTESVVNHSKIPVLTLHIRE